MLSASAGGTEVLVVAVVVAGTLGRITVSGTPVPDMAGGVPGLVCGLVFSVGSPGALEGAGGFEARFALVPADAGLTGGGVVISGDVPSGGPAKAGGFEGVSDGAVAGGMLGAEGAPVGGFVTSKLMPALLGATTGGCGSS